MRIAVLAHGHPAFSPGGGENAAYALYQALADVPGVSASFWAAASDSEVHRREEVVCMKADLEYLLASSDDPVLFRSSLDLSDGSAVASMLKQWCPDVIHAHHFLGIGLDLFWALRRWLPNVPIVYTLHEFLCLCPYHGQFLRLDGSLCGEPRLLDCAGCMPAFSIHDLNLRSELFRYWVPLVQSFVSPSAQLADVFVRSGLIAQESIRVIDNLLPALLESDAVELDGYQADVNCFGFFGNLSPMKGLDIVLKAVLLAREQGAAVELKVFGGFRGRAQAQSKVDVHYYSVIDALLEELEGCVECVGPYRQEQIPALMASVSWVVMGSRWRENAPVVIEEALACGRPLLVPDIGGMAEKVRHGLDGYHYTARSPLALADLMIQCTSDCTYWDAIRASMRLPPSRESVLLKHLDLYHELLG
jgi:glycosyltransferase involved in cell wall biosynthesis